MRSQRRTGADPFPGRATQRDGADAPLARPRKLPRIARRHTRTAHRQPKSARHGLTASVRASGAVRLAGANRQEVQVQTRGPDGGNPTPMRQGRRSGSPGPRRWRSPGGPARGRLVEAVGARPCRAQAKRQEAPAPGEPAAGGEAQCPFVVKFRSMGDGMVATSVAAYPGRSAGSRASGSP